MSDGDTEGLVDGTSLGCDVGVLLGWTDFEGRLLGCLEGEDVGWTLVLGCCEGAALVDGTSLGKAVGDELGLALIEG